MKRSATVAAAAAVIAAVGLSGCSNNHSSTSSSGPSNQTRAVRAPGGSSTAEVKDGHSYTVTGTAIGADMSDPTRTVRKSFEMDVTYP